MRVFEEVGMELRGGLSHQDNPDIKPGEFRGGSPFEESHQVHPLVDAGIGFFAGGDQFLREIHNQSDALPLFFLFSNAEKKSAQDWRETDEIAGRANLVKV